MLGWLAALAGPANAQELDLGIPMATPWEDLAAGEKDKESAAFANSLVGRFRARLSADLDSLEHWREGLLSAVRFARSRPERQVDYEKRPFWFKLLVRCARLFAPIL